MCMTSTLSCPPTLDNNTDHTLDNNTDHTLEDFHRDVFQDYLPVIIILIVLAVIGVVGNAITIKYYMSKDTRKPVIWLILSLAKTDFFVCLLLFAAAAELSVNILFRSASLCKIIYFLDYAIIYSSIMILALVSVDRYRKICKPFDTQISHRCTKYAVLILVITAFIISSRACVTYDVVEITLVNSSTQTVIGYQCETSDTESLAFVVGFFHYFDTVTVGAIFVVFLLAYSLILRALFIHRERVKRKGDAPNADATIKVGAEKTSVDELSSQMGNESNENTTQEKRLEKENVTENLTGHLQISESRHGGSKMLDYPTENANSETTVPAECTDKNPTITASFDILNKELSADELEKCQNNWKGENESPCKVNYANHKDLRNLNDIHVVTVDTPTDAEQAKMKETNEKDNYASNSLEQKSGTLNRRKDESKENHTADHDQTTNDNRNNVKLSSSARRVIRIKKYEILTTVMMLFVSVGFLLSFTPYFIASISKMYSSTTEYGKPRALIKASTHMMQKCAFLNSVINPFIYYIFNNDFRAYVGSMFSRKCF